MRIKRREFLRLFGGVSGAVVLGGLGLDQVLEVPEQIIEKARRGYGIETWKNTICRQCSGGCGIRVRLIDDVPVFIKGNAIYPINQGGMCPLGRSSLELLYNPDRIKTPIQRIGIPGSGRWESISWNDALTLVAEKLSNLRTSGRGHEVAFLGSDESDFMIQHIGRFMQAYGSPNYDRFFSAQNGAAPFLLTQGSARVPNQDLLGARLVLNFGSNFLEEGYSPVYFTKLYSRLRDASNGARARFIHIDSRMNLTAANADRWIPVRPGTYGALALGIAHVLIREELYDAGFVRDHTFGFDDWTDSNRAAQKGFKTLVLDDYYPERVSELTGVPSETILEISRELGITRPSVVLGGEGVVDNTNGTFSQIAVHSLNALLGNFENPGGIVQVDDPPFDVFEEVNEDETARRGNSRTRIADPVDGTYPLSNFSIDAYAENILADRPYPVSLLFINGGNALFQALNHHRFAEALRSISLVVSFASFINETNEYADLILPTPTFLEAWDEVSSVPSVAFTQVGIQQPVVAPFYEARSTGDILIDIAGRLGDPVRSAFTYSNYSDGIRHRVRGIYNSGTGAIASESVRSSWLEFMQQRGWQIGRYDSFEEFWTLLTDRGGWWNPLRSEKTWTQIFKTKSGRFEFYSNELKAVIARLVEQGQDESFLLRRLNISSDSATKYLPHYEPVKAEDEEEYPLFLTTFQTLTNRDGNGANQPLMQEMFGYQVRQPWNSWAEINPETADLYGISDGQWMWVQSSVSSVRVQAKILPGIMPDVVSIPFGLGHTSYGRYAAGHGINPNSIMKARFDRLSGKPALQATRVTISRAV